MITAQLFFAAASDAPHNPPIKAWLELEGSPNHHVVRFQRIAPNSAQISVCEVTTLTSTSPAAIVFATAVPASAPIKFVVAANTIASRGGNAFVETTAAIEFAVSLSPLMYSKTSATRMTVKISAMRGSRVFQDDMIDHVAGVAAPIHDLLQQFEQIFQKNHLQWRVRRAIVQIAQQLIDHLVRLAFNRLQLVVMFLDFLE